MNDQTAQRNGGTVTDESPYGHEHPILDRLADWVQATDPYTAPLDPEEITDEMDTALLHAGRDLNAAIAAATSYAEGYNREMNSRAWHIRAHIRELTADFLFSEYTDSTTDEPCDVEYNVTGFVAELVEGYERPVEVTPAYVGFLAYDPPEDPED
jgi:hypothetical protein